MPKLPTVENFGARQFSSPGRSVVGVNADIASNAEATSQARLASVYGNAADKVTNALDEYVKGEERQAASKARSDFLVGKIELDAKFKDDKDFATREERYNQEIAKLRERVGSGLSGRVRNEFDNQANVEVARSLATQKTHAFALKRDHNLAQLSETLKTNRDSLLRAEDPATRESLLKASQDTIKSMQEQGFLDKTKAAELSRGFVVDHAVSRVTMQPGDVQHELLQIPEGWSPGDKLPPMKRTGTSIDFIPEDQRVKIARAAMPAMNAKIAINKTDEIIASGGSVDSQLEKAKKITNPTVRNEVERRIKAEYSFQTARDKERLVQQSQAAADNIFKADLGAEAQLEEARKISDPELRDATVSRVKARINEQNALDTKKRNENKQAAWQVVMETKSTDSLTPEQRSSIDGTTLTAMDRYARTVSSGKEPVQDWKSWTELTFMSQDKLAAMDSSEYFTKYRNKLDNTHFDRGLALIKGAKSGEQKAQEKQISYKDADRVARDIAKIQGWKSKDKNQNKKIGQLSNALSDYVDNYVKDNDGKRPSRAEILKYANGIILPGEISYGKGMFTNDPDMTKLESLDHPDAAKFVLDAEESDHFGIAKATGIPVADIPKIIEGLKAAKAPITLKNIERAKEFYR